jgi:hypothetical protein
LSPAPDDSVDRIPAEQNVYTSEKVHQATVNFIDFVNEKGRKAVETNGRVDYRSSRTGA